MIDRTTLPILKKPEDLKKLQKDLEGLLKIRTDEVIGTACAPPVRELLVCGGTGCHSSESAEIIDALNAKLKEKKLDQVTVYQVGCFGFCAQGPIVKVMPDNVFYVKVKLSDIDELIETHLINNKHVDRLLFEDPQSGEKQHRHSDMNFYKKQLRVALRNCGLIDPENILEYIAADGFSALSHVLSEMEPLDVIDVIEASGLRGRGGGGFPTGRKWRLCNASKVMINTSSQRRRRRSGAFMDRSIRRRSGINR